MSTKTIKAIKYGAEDIDDIYELDIPADATCAICKSAPIAALVFTEPYYVAGVKVPDKFLLCVDHLLTMQSKITNH